MSAATQIGIRATELLASGFVSRPEALSEVRETVGDPHSGPGGRAYRVTLCGGLSFDVLPERGLDLGSLWHRGYPIAWRSPLAAPGPTAGSAKDGWIGRFGGGMLATCGLDNIGPARGDHGLHGSHHATRATDVVIERTADAGVVISGVVDSAQVFGRQVYLHRRIEARADVAEIRVRDRIVNEGSTAEPVALLYHLNFGAPFLMPGTGIDVPAGAHVPRQRLAHVPSWRLVPESTETVVEAVWEHSVLAVDAAGRAAATVTSTALGVQAIVSWDPEALPRCFEWVYPTRRGWALGIEPANAPLFGPDRGGEHAGAPMLKAGAELESGFVLALSALDVPPTRPH